MKQINRKHEQQGFTLIELVVVIAILGILAAFALPRFVQLSEQAHEANVRATAGAISAGVALVKAQWVTNGDAGDLDDVEGFGEGTIDVSTEGWPVSTSTANNPDNLTDDMCEDLWNALMQANAPSVATTASGTENYVASASAPECTFTYQPDGQAGTADAKQIIYDASTGDVTTTLD